MLEELKRQRIKGMVEAGGVADEALQGSAVVDSRWMGPVEKFVHRRPVIKATLAATLAASLAHSCWVLVTELLQ